MPAKCRRFHGPLKPSNLHEVTPLEQNWGLNPEFALLNSVLLLSCFVSLLKYYLNLHNKLLGRDCVFYFFRAPGDLNPVTFS